MTNVNLEIAYPYGVEYIDYAIEGSPKMFDKFSACGLLDLAKDEKVKILYVYDNRIDQGWAWED